MERKGKFLICAAAIGALSVHGLLGYTAIKNNKQFFDTTPAYAETSYIYESNYFIPRATYNKQVHYLVYDTKDARLEEGSVNNYTPIVLKWLTVDTFHIFINGAKVSASTAASGSNKFINTGYDTWQVFSDGIWALNNGQKSARRLGYNPNNGNGIGAPYVNSSYQPVYFYTAGEKASSLNTWHCNWSVTAETCLDNLIINNH